LLLLRLGLLLLIILCSGPRGRGLLWRFRFFLPARRFVCVRAVLGFACVFACAALVRLYAYGVGLSLICYWSISVAPVRGRHLLFFACRKEK
jgi:hypothetical protein